jgi:hypothetical protein
LSNLASRAAPLPIAATIALEMIGPMPGHDHGRNHHHNCKTQWPLDYSSAETSKPDT